MNITIYPEKLSGVVTPPPSKSQAHRFLIAAGLAQEDSVLDNLYPSKDIEATMNCLQTLGVSFGMQEKPGEIVVHGRHRSAAKEPPELDCGESGSTLRFLMPLALVLCGGATFLGHGRLMNRPLQPYFDIFDRQGITYEKTGRTLKVEGTLRPGRYELPGDVSSQFVTGLLFALPLLDGDSEIVLTSPLESKSYVDQTLEALSRFGVFAAETSSGYAVQGKQKYLACSATIEGDYSQAAFFLAMRGMGNDIKLQGLNPNSVQGDRRAVDYCQLLSGDGDVELDMSDCPDLLPALAAQASLRANGAVTVFTHAARLRLKESDRLASVTAVLRSFGAQIEEREDGLTVRGRDTLEGGSKVSCYGDHRIAMMAACAATRCALPVFLLGAECVDKSYPSFWEDYEKLGANIVREPEKK